MKVFAISDLHFGFRFIFNLRKENNLFPEGVNSVKDYENLIVKNWNEKVSNEDTVVFLGDLTFDTKFEWQNVDGRRDAVRSAYREYINAFRVMQRLNGKIIWIAGNHDRPFMNAQKIYKLDDYITPDERELFRSEMSKCISNYEVDPIQINNVIFSHEQFVGTPSDCINYHGHIHIGSTSSITNRSIRHKNVNVEFVDFTPVLVNELL